MQDYLTYLTSALLGCGYGDLSVLKDCKYNFVDLVEECKNGYGNLDLNLLCYVMFDFGLTEISESIEKRIEQLQEELKDIDDTETNNETEEMRDELANLLKSSFATYELIISNSFKLGLFILDKSTLL